MGREVSRARRVKKCCAVQGCFWSDLKAAGLGLVDGGLPLPKETETGARSSKKKGKEALIEREVRVRIERKKERKKKKRKKMWFRFVRVFETRIYTLFGFLDFNLVLRNFGNVFYF